MKTLRELCLADSFPPERLERIEALLAEEHRSGMPAYIRIIVGIGAWIASLFFFAAIFAYFGWSGEDHLHAIGCVGVVLLAAAVLVGRQHWGVFSDQCALAISFAGQGMIYAGFIDEHSQPLAMAALFSIALAAGLYVVYPSILSRVMTCLFASQVVLLWIYSGDNEPFAGQGRNIDDLQTLITLFWLMHLAGICRCFMWPRWPVLFAPLGHALVASLAAWQIENMCDVWTRPILTGETHPVFYLFSGYLRAGMTAAALFVVAVWAAGGIDVLRAKAPLFIALGLAFAVLAWLGLGGVLLALLFLLLGFAIQDRAILGIGLVLFPVFLVYYYYNLNLDLLVKSGVLVASGGLILFLRATLLPAIFPKEKV